MAKKRVYSKPEITKVKIDQTFTLMQGSPPVNPHMMPMGRGNKGPDTPFASPFDDKPFS